MTATYLDAAQNTAPRLQAHTSNRSADLTLAFLCLVLSICASLKVLGYGRDYSDYLSYYESIPPILSFQDGRFEPGFHFSAWLFRSVFDLDINWFIFVICVTALGIKFFLFRKYLAYPIIAALLYAVIFYPIHEYTQFRVAISLAFSYLAVHLLLQKRYLWASLLFPVSFLFHYSSILVAMAAVAGLFVRDRKIIALIIGSMILTEVLAPQLKDSLVATFGSLNPLSTSYLDNRAMIEGVSVLSVNNLLLAGAITAYIILGRYPLDKYQSVFLTLTIACLGPIALIPDVPIIAQRSKEVLFVAVIFLACRSKLNAANLPGFVLVCAMAALLGYLNVISGVFFT